MIPKSFPSTTGSLHNIFSYSFTPIIFHTKIPHIKLISNPPNDSFKPTNLSMFGIKRKRHQNHRRLLPLCASRGSDHEDSKAIETVYRLYEAIKHKNLNEMSEIIGHDCFCVCSFDSMFKTFSGKKLRTIYAECSKTHKPIGTGFSFHVCHIYEGKVLIRNVEMILEPLLHIEPPTLKMVGLVASIMGQVASRAILKGENRKTVYVMGSLVTLVTIVIILRLYRS
ncbi:Polyketide cyclase SnoaL-like domain-containing protein [Artemisia annua]|uniref:Polyketide cyclase SnoaL-like domain-containing protein n=1 Tax=Artemisia annua TaxID=35608 RepID=A0A2U1L2G6_ARTAN|nr:Polyketide cyclase SnoaL-like domain-containing protein [Artemisia annua]